MSLKKKKKYKKYNILQDTSDISCIYMPTVETYSAWPLLKSIKSLENRLLFKDVVAGLHPQPAYICISLSQRKEILISIRVLHS